MSAESRIERPSLDAVVAEHLATTLRSVVWDRSPDGISESGRQRAALRALELYRFTAPFFEASDLDGAPGAFDQALAVLGEIADGYALRSRPWTAEERATLPMPRRHDVEYFIRREGVDEWAAEQGYPLEFIADEDGNESSRSAANDNAEARPSFSTSELHAVAVTFLETAEAYDGFVRIRDSEKGRKYLHSERLRNLASAQIAGSRQWMVWVRDNLVSEQMPLGVAMMHVGRGSFVATWDETDSAAGLPSRGFIRELIWVDNAAEWLMGQGCELPDWLENGED